MQATRYFWSVIQPDRFSKAGILTHLEGVNHNIEDLLQLRRQLIKAGIPTYHLLTSIRELEEVKALLVLSATKKFLSNSNVSVQQEFPDFKTRLGWRESFDIFWIRVKLQWRLRYAGRFKAFQCSGE